MPLYALDRGSVSEPEFQALRDESNEIGRRIEALHAAVEAQATRKRSTQRDPSNL